MFRSLFNWFMSDIMKDNDMIDIRDWDMEDVHLIANWDILGHRAAEWLVVRKLSCLRSWIQLPGVKPKIFRKLSSAKSQLEVIWRKHINDHLYQFLCQANKISHTWGKCVTCCAVLLSLSSHQFTPGTFYSTYACPGSSSHKQIPCLGKDDRGNE